MNQRPVSLSVIAWILIVMGALSLITVPFLFNNPNALEMLKQNPLPIPVQFATSMLSPIVSIVSGIAILKGKNWGRFFYVIWWLIGFAVGLITTPVKVAMIPGTVVFLVIVYFLFNRKASEFFTSGKVEGHE